jgi:ssDNA-binding Zn-finger/Zn-ribbon topoisomerase 1
MPHDDHEHGNVLCPECDIQLWFDPDARELYCPNCSFKIEVVDVNADYL